MERLPTAFAAGCLALVAACSSCGTAKAGPGTESAASPAEGKAVAIFAGGCFWCMEKPFEQLDGVESVTSGYVGGDEEHPTYEQVSSGTTGHAEAVRIVYDPERVDYARLLEVFWHNVDPTQADGQFCDHGSQYRTGIFVLDAEQKRLARQSLARVEERFDERVHTEITDAGPFWVAEAYHQNYYETHPRRYRSYRQACGRDRRLRELWGEQAGH